MTRPLNHQQVAWFWDLYQRHLIDLDPPYQRRSVWNQEYKDAFIDTVLMGYPSPAIFIYQETSPEGGLRFSVVDGKQRLTALFEFAEDKFPVSEKSSSKQLAGKYFKDLDRERKAAFWSYQITVETLLSSQESIINDIFDRLNRNVARLTRQELRHARFSGEFISEAERLADQMSNELPPNFPNIARASRKQMKDVEFVSQLLLLLEEGPRSYSQDAIDQAYSDRDEEWMKKDEVLSRFRQILEVVRTVLSEEPFGVQLRNSSLRNQADFYSFIGALDRIGDLQNVDTRQVSERTLSFLTQVADESLRVKNPELLRYWDSARSASNDIGPRTARIEIIVNVLTSSNPGQFAATNP